MTYKTKSEIRKYVLEHISPTNPLLSIYDATPNPVIEKVYAGYKHIQRIQTVSKYNRTVTYDMQHIPLFTAIEVETINRCNGKCSFCPVNANVDPRPYARMENSLFLKIINELHHIHYTGLLSLYSNNEPFLDVRMPDMLKYAREMLPDAGLFLFTNCSLLTLDKFQEVIGYLDYLVIDNYNSDKTMLNDNPKAIYEYCSDKPELLSKVTFAMRPPDEVLTNRGGQAPNKRYSDIVGFKVKCHMPFGQLVIRPDGRVSLCCNDALGTYTLGDVNTQSLRDIWYSDRYMKIRKEILENGRRNLTLCKDCDTMNMLFTLPNRK